MPVEGVAKAPHTPDNPRVGRRLVEAGRRCGVNFTGACDRYPNTVKAHVALQFILALEDAGAVPPNTQDRYMAELFHAYFTAGDYPSIEVLVDRASRIDAGPGLDLAALRSHLEESSSAEAQVRQEAATYSRQGVSGVPSFFVDGEFLFSGAQPPAQITAALAEFV